MKITYKYDDESGQVEFFADGNEVCSWSCEDKDGLELSVKDFYKIFGLGVITAHVAGQAEAGIDPSYSNAVNYFNTMCSADQATTA